MYKNKYTAILAVLLLGVCVGCGSKQTEVAQTEAVPAAQSTTAPSLPGVSAAVSASLSVGNTGIDLSDADLQALNDTLSSLSAIDYSDITIDGTSEEWCFTLDGELTVRRLLSSVGWIILDSDMNVYNDAPDLNALAMQILSANGTADTKSQPAQPYYSIKCPEPASEAEYVKTAEDLLTAWLTSLQAAGTDDHYRNTGFELAKPEVLTSSYTGYKNNYLACGMVNGVKEFCVELCFTAQDCGDDTFYDQYYQEGRYTAAGTYWSGQYICGRFRYENGICSLVDMATRDDSDAMQDGLNGIPHGKARTFYDFVRLGDVPKLTETTFKPYGSFTVSKNLIMTKDGKQLHIDVYGFQKDAEDDNTITAVMSKRSYNEENDMIYGTGVYYTDNGTGQKSITLPKDFKISFDDYDGDGNPDYCMKYDDDADGGYYVLNNIISDGRILNLSGRAYTGGIYLAGCHAPSPRLQKADGYAYTGIMYKDGVYYPTDPDGNQIKLPDVNMYSDRYYLPDDMRYYASDENTVHCFVWNNTAEDVTTDTAYSIEIFDGGKWVNAANGTAASSTIKPRSYADISYDISGIKDRADTVYRIVQKCGDITAYGKFWLKGRYVNTLSIDSVQLTSGALYGSFIYTDAGPDKTAIDTAVITDGTTEYPLILTDNEDGRQMFLLADGTGLAKGSYTLTVNGVASRDITVTDAAPIPVVSGRLENKGGNIVLILSSDAGVTLKQTVLYKKSGDRWVKTSYAAYTSAGQAAAENEELTVPFVDTLDTSDLDKYIQKLYETLKTSDAPTIDEYAKANGIYFEPSMTYEQFAERFKADKTVTKDDKLLAVVTVYDSNGNEWKKMVRTQ